MTCAGCNNCAFDQPDVPPGHHEIHITVMPEDADRFVEVCTGLSIKSILVHTELPGGDTRGEPMTSHKFIGTYQQAMLEAENITYRLILGHVVPVRVKIETSPSDTARFVHPSGYWEAHLEVAVPLELETAFRVLIQQRPRTYVSRNANKTTQTHVGFMITVRGYNKDKTTFMRDVQQTESWLNIHGLDINRRMIEYCWHDSNPEYDAEWIRHE